MPSLKFKRKHGVIGIPREMIRSPAYRDLSLPSRCLIVELQDVWNPGHISIHFSVRRVSESLGVSISSASRSFQELLSHGFIKLAHESNWVNGKAREWQLNWLPINGLEPTDEWKGWPKVRHGNLDQSSTRGTVTHKTVPPEIRSPKNTVRRERKINELH